MTKHYIVSIDSLITTFSRVESGKEFDFSIKTENTNLEDEAIAVGDKILATIDDKVYYNFVVNEVSIGSLNLKKTFEIEKGIGLTSDKIGNFEIISQENYNSICTKLFSDFSIINSDNNNKKTDAIKIILNDKYTGRFVYKVVDFLHKVDKLDKISKYFIKNADPLYTSIKTDEVSLTSIFKTSKDLLKKEDLTFNDGKPRFFEDIIFNREDENYYLSTEWTSGKGSRLDLDSFKLLLLNYYPEYSIFEDNGELFLSNYLKKTSNIIQVNFTHKSFHKKTEEAGLIFSEQLIQRFIASLCTKPFVICSGLSGSGKTKLAQAFALWICESEEQYRIIPVGADWTNREPLLGYPNALQENNYVTPENGALDLINRARLNDKKPYFLILDEMNLSHVERYFADFLSTMESGDAIPLHTIDEEEDRIGGIPKKINLPCNLFIIGTVNIDETTYMFSPKVLDRANTIEFRLTETDLKTFISSDIKLDMDLLKGEGAGMGESFVTMATQKTDKNLSAVEKDLMKFFKELKKSGAEFGYRTASEIGRLMFMLKELDEKGDNLLDIAIMQKLLPKLHGSRNKLTKVLPVLGSFCLVNYTEKIKEDYLDKFASSSLTEEELSNDKNIKYPISFEKICRMYKNAIENGFASYAEA
jgi:5-methylcytosine-specific restriction protein B